MAKEDYLLRLSLLDQESNRLQEQLQVVNREISELESLRLSIEKLDKTKEKEILANLGRGIFIKSEVKEKELFVNVGSNVVLKKKPQDTIKIIDKQISQLDELKQNLLGEIEKINSKLQELVEEAQGSQ